MASYGAPTGRGEADLYSDKGFSSGHISPMLPTTYNRHQPPPPPTRRNKIAAWWSSQSPRTRKILYLTVLAVVLLAIILGIALGLTVGKPKEDPDPSTDYVPSTISGNHTSLLTSGSWYTAPENGTNFSWNSSFPALENYRADSQGVDIIINTTQKYQTIDGFGGAMTDSSAYLLNRLKQREASLYDRVMDFMFHNATGVGVTRVSMGASDFSVGQEYSYIPQPPAFAAAGNKLNNPNSLLSSFSVDNTQSGQHTIPVLVDALKRNPNLKVILTPWSPPAFMKSNNTMDGGNLRDNFIPLLAQYYATSAAAWSGAGVKPWAMTLQNEPSHIASYPSMGMDAGQQSQLAVALKTELAKRGLGEVQVWGHDDNYSGYQSAADIVNDNATAIDAVAFHCYRGDPAQIGQFESALRNGVQKDVHMTECTGTGNPSNRWPDIQGWLSRVYWPVSLQNSKSIIQWNLALDSGYGPHLKSSYCSSCTGSLTLSSKQNPANPYVKYNDQLYLTAHFSSASTDLTNVGGGKAVRVGADQGLLYSLRPDDWSCLNWVAYAASIKGDTLQNAANGDNAQMSRRIGLVIANTCQEAKDVVVSSDGRRTILPVKEGLSTFVWTAP